jgi:hypothetical protein
VGFALTNGSMSTKTRSEEQIPDELIEADLANAIRAN